MNDIKILLFKSINKKLSPYNGVMIRLMSESLTDEIKKTVIKSHLKLLDDVIKIAKNGNPSCNWIIKDIQKLKKDVRMVE